MDAVVDQCNIHRYTFRSWLQWVKEYWICDTWYKSALLAIWWPRDVWDEFTCVELSSQAAAVRIGKSDCTSCILQIINILTSLLAYSDQNMTARKIEWQSQYHQHVDCSGLTKNDRKNPNWTITAGLSDWGHRPKLACMTRKGHAAHWNIPIEGMHEQKKAQTNEQVHFYMTCNVLLSCNGTSGKTHGIAKHVLDSYTIPSKQFLLQMDKYRVKQLISDLKQNIFQGKNPKP